MVFCFINDYLNRVIEKALLEKLETYCAYTERCNWDVQQKCHKLNIPSADTAAYIKHLEDNGFLSEARYATSFVNSKANRGWGPAKIRNALMKKRVNTIHYQTLLSQMDKGDQLQQLIELANKKRPKIKAKDEKDLKQKLIRFLMSKGYSFELIRQVV